MTFCFFTAQYLPTPGGVERYTWNLARRCVAAGHRAIIVTSALPGLPARERDDDGLEIYRLPAFPVMGGRFPVLRPFAPAADLWAQSIDFAVIQTRMYTQSIWAARQCRRRGIPALVIDHSTGYMMHGGLGGVLGRWYEHLACGIIRRYGFPFYGVSGDVCHWLKTFGISAAGTLPNAVDPEELAALARAEDRADWRQRLQVPADGHLIAFVGRLIPEKGALQLAKAVQQLPGCVLAVAGTGPEEEALRAMGGSVHALGALPHAQIVQLLSQADCYCLPTEYAEGFPTTLLEAAACRCPIVCTHTAGTGELLPDGDYAVYLDDTRPESLAAALTTVLQNPGASRQRCERAFRNLAEHFTWQAVFATMMKTAQNAQSAR
ncbi:MAG TPA: glycosyltransferase family 4 protein [Candidatus Gemmiger excrementigallinarum]|uniref:Glycosyltransferase family 4 protein n=1 Tax=Candidatus Gemmiger excrementigallinarum TaxID=2838609 RepID=A0A9D2JAA7_9FIRM|nr:glycosyltransferase family 4 protein [Candidatus Gemmiger excrementigallinarum]